MSTTDNNNHASSSTENNSNSYETRMKSLEDQISNLSLAFTRYMKEPIRESYGNSDNQRSKDESETENEQGDDESIRLLFEILLPVVLLPPVLVDFLKFDFD
ncbi:hypothetical protein RB653_001790 [Dictyostelium firmibasis]|uniref:Uncharacterized protein n=1 Tax=Dictyostelium firmibasis TaxID=79012 RepID=A0AAN7TPL5_9MYCE